METCAQPLSDEDAQIYAYARTLTGRCGRTSNGGYVWRWGCGWKDKVLHVWAIIPPGGTTVHPSHVWIHEAADGCCPTRPSSR